MVTVRDVLENGHPTTKYESSILLAFRMMLMLIVFLIIAFIVLLNENGIQGVTDTLFTFNAVSAAILIWILLTAAVFLSGVRYIRRLNRAVQRGIRYEGCVVEKRRLFSGAKSPVKHRCRIQIDGGTIVKTPVFYDIPDSFRYCSVYYYKKKYYFTDFRWFPPQI